MFWQSLFTGTLQSSRRTCVRHSILLSAAVLLSTIAQAATIFNVRDFGTTGNKSQNARAAIQKALDTCAAAGGGTVYMPAGEYTAGTIHLRSHVRIYIESGATLFAS